MQSKEMREGRLRRNDFLAVELRIGLNARPPASQASAALDSQRNARMEVSNELKSANGEIVIGSERAVAGYTAVLLPVSGLGLPPLIA